MVSVDPTKIKKIQVSYSAVQEMVGWLALAIKDAQWEVTDILAVSKGGLVPAALLTYKLLEEDNTKHIDLHNVTLRSYRGIGDRDEVELVGAPYFASLDILNRPTTVIVDDLTDSGETMKYLANKMPKAKAVTLLAKEGADFVVDFAGMPDVDKDVWYTFVWEPDAISNEDPALDEELYTCRRRSWAAPSHGKEAKPNDAPPTPSGLTINPRVVSEANWRRYSTTIHNTFMVIMGLERGSAVEVGFLGNEFAGEAGELCNEIKKFWRDGMSRERFNKLRGEIADVHIMLEHIQQFFGIGPEEAAVAKIKELHERWPWIPRKLDYTPTVQELIDAGCPSDLLKAGNRVKQVVTAD